MRLAQLFEIAEKAGNSPVRACSDKREMFVYMDVLSAEYRRQAAKLHSHRSGLTPQLDAMRRHCDSIR